MARYEIRLCTNTGKIIAYDGPHPAGRIDTANTDFVRADEALTSSLKQWAILALTFTYAIDKHQLVFRNALVFHNLGQEN